MKSHTFCAECIQNWSLHLTTKQCSCPNCGARYRKLTISRDQIAYNVIGEIEVYCNNSELGCLWKGHVCELEQHLKNCVYGPANLPKWLAYSNQEPIIGLLELSQKNKENQLSPEDKKDSLLKNHKPSALTLELLKEKGEKMKSLTQPIKNEDDGAWKEIEEYINMFSIFG